MSTRSYGSWSSRPVRSARSSRSTVSRPMSRPSSVFSFVESNFRVVSPQTPVVPEVYIQNRRKARQKEITINDAPMMLLPKARVRDSLDYYDQFRRSYSVVADTDVQGLHISTIQSVNALEGLGKLPHKSVLKSRRSSVSRSEADSGFCSLKRAVTFDNLSHSQSSVYRSYDDLDNLSDSSDEYKPFNDTNDHLPDNQTTHEDFPDHLESFGQDEAVFADPPRDPPRPMSRTEGYESHNRRRHGQQGNHDISTCEICGVVLSETERVKRKFGKVDKFMDWVMSKWGPDYYERLRRELQYVPRPSYVYRNHTPHFCNFVNQISLHDRPGTGKDTEGADLEFDDEVEYVMESAEGRLISKYRKTSSASSRGGLIQTPKLEDYECETVNDKDIENWLKGKKISNKAMFRKYFSSIPEMKEDIVPSGTEGRPGSPSSLDGDSRHEEETQQQPVTGIEVRLSSPIKSELIALSTDDKKSRADDVLSSRSGMSIPEETNEGVGRESRQDTFDEYSKGLKSADQVVVPSGSDSENNNRAESPRQPPPSPEPLKQKIQAEVPLPATQPSPKKRGCATKKTKKPVERSRKMKQIEEPREPEPVKVEETPVTDTPVLESDKVDSKVDLKVPDLPTNLDNKEKHKKEKSKTKKHLIEVEDDLFKPDPADLLNDQMKQNRADFDWSNMDTNGIDDIKRPTKIKSWISGRLALSQQSSRFELPMDMKNLEKMTPQEYIKKHCIITSRRQHLYQKIFMKNKEKSHTIIYKDLDRSLKDVLVNTITSEQVQEVLNTLNITETTKVDYQLFAGMAAFAERVLYPSFITEDTREMPEYQREKIECADFSALPWKLHGVKVNPEMRKLLEQIS